MSTEITINQDIVEINVTEEVVVIEAPSGAYPLPSMVSSVFGRTGNVVAQEGDYTLTQLGDVTISTPSNGQVLRYNGTTWVNATESFAGTVTSVDMSVPTGLTISGNPITTSGTLAVGLGAGYVIPTQAALDAKQDDLNGTGIVKSTAGTITYLSDNTANWNTAYNDSIVSASVTGTATKTLTLNQQDGGSVTASWTDTDTGLTSVGLSMPSAFSVANSPLTANGTLSVTGAGTTAQYVRGDGSLATFPTIAQEAQRLITEVYNSTGATLTKGTVVYINGGQGNLPTVTKAIATGDATSAQTYGVVQSDITNMNNGFVVAMGSLTNLDTQIYPVGTQLYLSATTAGAWTSVKQYAPNHLVYVGIVVRSHPTQGVVEIRIQNGYELDELHDVSAQNPTNGDILQYVSATDLWTKVAGTTTNIAEGTNLYFTDTRARAAITLTTTGTSGAATYSGGTLNIPQYQGVLTNPITGTGTSGQVAYFNGTSSLTSNATFAFTPTSQLLVNNSVTAASAIARGTNLTPTLTAAANNDVLVGLDITPTFTNGAFTGVQNYAARVQGNLKLRSNSYLSTSFNNARTSLVSIETGTDGAFFDLYGNSGLAGTQDLGYAIFAKGVPSSISNSEVLEFRYDKTTRRYSMNSIAFGSGSVLPIGLYTGTNTNQLNLFTSGNVGVNQNTDAGFRLDVNGTARVQGVLTITADAVINGLTVGRGAGNIDTNTALGISALSLNTGNSNTAIGRDSITNTTGSFNTGVGRNTLRYVSSGGNNTGIGGNTLINVSTGSSNTAVGVNALQGITTASNNTAIGRDAGGFISGGSVSNITGSNSIFIGHQSYPLADSQTNQIVIGYQTTGLGSNTTVLGNASTVTTAIYGDLLLGTTTTSATKLTVSGSETASSAIARGGLINTTLVAAANNDVLVGLDINPTFTNGAFTGVSNVGIRTNNSFTYLGGTLRVSGTTSNPSGAGGFFVYDGSELSNFAYDYGTTSFKSIASNGIFIRWLTSNTERMRLFNTGNLALNTTTDGGFRLDVNGTARVQGAITGTVALTSATGSGIGNDFTTNHTVNTSASYVGTRFLSNVTTSAANTSTIIAQQTSISISSNTNLPSAIQGCQLSMNVNGASGTLGQVTGIISSGFIANGATVTNIYHFKTDGLFTPSTGIVNNQYGYYYDELYITPSNKGYAFYSKVNPSGGTLASLTDISIIPASTKGVGISNAAITPNASAILDITSTTKGVLFPRMTTTQKNAIATPAAGLMVYDTTLNQMSYYNGTTWINF